MPPSILPDRLLYKNRLQEYAQKSALSLPVYQTVNEGFPHAPKFRSTVLVDGTNYTSNLTFLHRKAAEQEVAKYALDCIANKTIECPPITKLEFKLQDPMGCKSILLEFAVKSNRKIPTYKTRCEGGLGPVFVSSVVFDGRLYTGEVAGSKKFAEQLAAGTAIRELLEGSNSGNLLHEIVKSKGKCHSASQPINELSITKNNLSIAFQPAESPSQQQINSPVRSPSLTRFTTTAFQPETPSQQQRNIVQPATNFNSSDRAMGPYTEEKRIIGTQNSESVKRFNACGRMTGPNTEGKRVVATHQIVESKKRVDACARMTSPNAKGKRTSDQTQNVESKNIFNSCARMTATGPSKEGKLKTETQNLGPKINRFNSLGIMVGHNREGKRKSETQNLEPKKSFNSSGRMISPNVEGKRKFETQNLEPKKSFNSSGRMI